MVVVDVALFARIREACGGRMGGFRGTLVVAKALTRDNMASWAIIASKRAGCEWACPNSTAGCQSGTL